MQRKYNKKIGKIGEDISSDFLIKNGYEILERNFISRNGEIDIIAKENEEYVFCEVKTRRNFSFGYPIDAVNYPKIKRILRVAKYYLYVNHLYNKTIRFDVIEVYLNNGKAYINHVKKILL